MIAAVSSEDKAQAARDAGADEAIVYPRGPVRQGRAESAGRTVQGRGRPGRGGRHLRSGRRRLCRAGAARDRVGGPLPRRRLPRRHPEAAAQPDLAQELRRVRGVLGRLRRARPQGQCRACRGAVPAVGWARSPPVSATFPLERGGEAIAALAARKRDRQARGDARLVDSTAPNRRVLELAGTSTHSTHQSQLENITETDKASPAAGDGSARLCASLCPCYCHDRYS